MKSAAKSLLFISGWMVTAQIGLWAMALYGAILAIGIIGGMK